MKPYIGILLFVLSIGVTKAQQNSLVLFKPVQNILMQQGDSLSRILPDSVFYSTEEGAITYKAYSIVDADSVALPEWLKFEDEPLSFGGKPVSEDIGLYNIVLQASINGFSLTDTFQIEVIESYLPPVKYRPLENQSVLDNAPLQWTLADSTFYDIYGLSLTYTAKELKEDELHELPIWLQFNPETLHFVASPARPEVGFYQIVVEASNGYFSSADTFQIEVVKVNIPPVLAKPFAGLLLEEGFDSSQLNVSSYFADADGDTLIYSISNSNPAIVTADINDSTLTFTEVSIGSTEITITATDAEGVEVSDVFSIIVREYQEVFSFTTDNTGSNGLIESWVRSLHIENDNEIWIGTDQGLSIYNPQEDTWTNSFKEGNRGDGRNQILQILETSTDKKILLVMRGLQVANENGYEYFDNQDIPALGDFVMAGQIDANDKLWLTIMDVPEVRIVRINLATMQVELNELAISEQAQCTSMALDADNKPWVATSKGLVHYNGTEVIVLKQADGLSRDEISSVTFKNGKIYAAMNGFVNIIDGDNITHLRNDYMANSHFIRVDDDESIWTSSYAWGLQKYHASTGWQSLKLNFFGDNFVFGYPIYNAKKDSQGITWVATRWGLVKYHDESFPFATPPVLYNTFDGLPANDVFKILKDNRGNMWFPTYINGLSKYDGQTWTWTTQTLPFETSIWLQNTTAAYIAKNGDLWLGGAGGASKSSDGETWESFLSVIYNDPRAVLNMVNVYAFAEDTAGNIWAGGVGWAGVDMGLNKYDGENWTTFRVADGLKGGQINTLFGDSKGNVWVSYQGLFESAVISKIDGENTMTHFISSEISTAPNFSSVTQIIEASNGDIWVATNSGIGVYNGTTWSTFNMSNGLLQNSITQMAGDGLGNVWVAYNPSQNLGVSMYNGTAWQHFNKDNGLPSNQINTLQTLVTSSGSVGSRTKNSGGTLWLGTVAEGVSKIDIDGFLALGCTIDQPQILVQQNADRTYTLTASITGDNYRWYLDNAHIQNANSRTYLAAEEGNYTVEVIAGICTSDISAPYELSLALVTEIEPGQGQETNLFPNPATEVITVSLNNNHEAVAVSIFDVSGRLVKEERTLKAGKNITVSVAGLAPGVYILHLKSNQRLVKYRFVKH